MVNQETYQRIPKRERPPSAPKPIKVVGALGHSLQVRGIWNFPILVTRQELVLECMIVGGHSSCIFGMNFMSEFKVCADFGIGEMQIGQETVCLENQHYGDML